MTGLTTSRCEATPGLTPVSGVRLEQAEYSLNQERGAT